MCVCGCGGDRSRAVISPAVCYHRVGVFIQPGPVVYKTLVSALCNLKSAPAATLADTRRLKLSAVFVASQTRNNDVEELGKFPRRTCLLSQVSELAKDAFNLVPGAPQGSIAPLIASYCHIT